MARLTTLLPIRLEMGFEVEVSEDGDVIGVFLGSQNVTGPVLLDANAWTECVCAAADRVEVAIPDYRMRA